MKKAAGKLLGSRKSQKTSKNKNPSSSRARDDSSPRPYTIRFANNDQMNKYKELEPRGVKPTLFYCHYTCLELGIDRVVGQLAKNLGYQDFMYATVPNRAVTGETDETLPERPPLTYHDLTLEFLSSFSMKTMTPPQGNPVTTIRFRLFNTQYDKTLDEVNGWFDWDASAQVTRPESEVIPGYNPDLFWRQITDGELHFLANSSRVSEVIHAGLRYYLKCLMHTLNPKSEMGKVGNVEPQLLWRSSIKPDAHQPSSQRLNLGYLLCKRFDDIRNHPRMKSAICIGGMITWIAYKLGRESDLVNLDPIEEQPYVNLACLQRSGYLRDAEGTEGKAYIWLVKEVPWCYLPNRAMSSYPEGNQWRVPTGTIAQVDLTSEHMRRRHQQQQRQQEQHPQQQEQQPLQQYSRRSSSTTTPSSSQPNHEAIMSALGRIEVGMSNLTTRVTSLETDHRRSMYTIYDHYVQQGGVIHPEGHPSWYPYPTGGSGGGPPTTGWGDGSGWGQGTFTGQSSGHGGWHDSGNDDSEPFSGWWS